MNIQVGYLKYCVLLLYIFIPLIIKVNGLIVYRRPLLWFLALTYVLLKNLSYRGESPAIE